ncbi:hypothetical protein F5148DRAFT_1203340, partial [Russula earlei]
MLLFVYPIGLGIPFPVEIEGSETVGQLKDAIWQKNPNDFKDIDARRLVLYQVDLPDDEDLEEAAKQAAREISIVVEDPKIRESESPTSVAD